MKATSQAPSSSLRLRLQVELGVGLLENFSLAVGAEQGEIFRRELRIAAHSDDHTLADRHIVMEADVAGQVRGSSSGAYPIGRDLCSGTTNPA